LDHIEAQFINQSGSGVSATDETFLTNVVKATSQILVAMEREKDVKKLKARNVIISGLQPKSDVSDTELVESFCEQHLTVKPHLASSRRIGNDPSNSTVKLCVTLNSEESAQHLLESATILRRSPDIIARRVYINPDLTKAQANEAYKRRWRKESPTVIDDCNVTSIFVSGSSSLSTTAVVMAADGQ